VRVEGHTDDRPIRTARFPSNWDLSAARAVYIVDALVTDYGLPPDQLSAAGYASFRPVDTNDTPEGRARNRRVDVVLLHEDAAMSEPPGASTAAASAGGARSASFIPEPAPPTPSDARTTKPAAPSDAHHE
jgi:chemotaxis protein MotB